MAHLSTHAYGKDRVRLTKVVREGSRHQVLEFTLYIRLYGDFDKVYTEDDNSYCVPTDTMKNTVYVLAKRHTFDAPEAFARIVAEHFVGSFEHVTSCEVRIEQDLWQRIRLDGKRHDHSFIKERARRTAFARRDGKGVEVRGGIKDLEVLKTTGSSFAGFLKDENTILREVDDRIMATTVEAEWTYREAGEGVDRNDAFSAARETILEVFAGHQSPSVQSTMYRTGEKVLAGIPAIDSISMTMPNQHHILFDLSPFGEHNRNEIFFGIDAPSGVISATVTR